MTTPTITLYPDTLPAKGQANDAFDVNVNSFLNWLTLTNGPELQGLVTYTNDVANTVLATALAGDLPALTGKAGNYIRANAAEDGGEFRTPLQIKSDIGLSATDSPTFNAITSTASVSVAGSVTASNLVGELIATRKVSGGFGTGNSASYAVTSTLENATYQVHATRVINSTNLTTTFGNVVYTSSSRAIINIYAGTSVTITESAGVISANNTGAAASIYLSVTRVY